jgi:hypothetical protein
MARYGIDYYGLSNYGSGGVAVVDFDASPVLATPTGYGQITVTWTPPTGDWSRLRVVRNTYGFPLSVDDGAIVADEPKNFSLGSYIDNGEVPNNIGLRQGISYHYSIFVLDAQSESWIKAGNALGISVKNYGSLDFMYNNLPAIYRNTQLASVTDNNENPDLRAFLSVFAFAYDLYKTNAELSYKSYDTAITYAPIVPEIMRQFGLAFEPELGLQQSRIFLRNAIHINKQKGSLQGIKDFIKAFTGYDEVTTAGKNLMLDYNDSSFEEGLGNWQIVIQFDSNSVAIGDAVPLITRALPAEVSPYIEPSSPTLFPNKRAGSLKVLANSWSPSTSYTGGTLELACGLITPKTKGIPVKEGFAYTFSIYSRAKTVAREVTVDIRWFDRNGEEISRAGEESKRNNSSSWSTRVATTSIAPVNAYFAVPYLRIANVSKNEIHYFDCAQFEQSSEGATTFEEARQINIVLKATRVNQFKNPSFDGAIAPWVAINATATQDLAIFDEDRNSSVSLKLTPTTNDQVSLKYNEFIEVLEGFWYSFSIYTRTGFLGEPSADLTGSMSIDWYDANKNFIETTTSGAPERLSEFYEIDKISRAGNVLTVYTVEPHSLTVGGSVRFVDFGSIASQGTTYNLTGLNGVQTVTGIGGRYFQVVSSGSNIPAVETGPVPVIQDLKFDFIRTSYSDLSPENAVYAKPKFNWTNALTTQVIHLDAAMFEQSTAPKPYFDGYSGFTSTDDLIWEDGQAFLGRSHYYKNRVATQLRLIAQLPSYLMNGTPFRVDLAQPGL